MLQVVYFILVVSQTAIELFINYIKIGITVSLKIPTLFKTPT